MDSFSVTALTSLCASISNSAVSAAAELDTLPPQAHFEGHRSIVDALKQVTTEVPALENALQTAAVIAPQLQVLLQRTLTLGDAAVVRLHKQIMRVDEKNAYRVDGEYVARHGVLLAAYAEMAGFMAHILSLSTKQEQHGVMEADEEQKLLYAQTSLSDCANITAIFPDNDTSDTTSNTSPSDEKSASADGPEDAPEGAPPAYTPADPAPKSTSGFASAWQAFTSHFTPRADPLASALCRAITNGDMSQVRGLLAQGAPLSGRDENSQTSLQCAIAADNEPAFQLLLAAGASTQGTSSGWLGGGEMPLLFQAAVAGKLKIAQALVDAGADVHETSIFGQPYFYDVCKFGTRQGVEFLLQNGASATTQSVGGRPVLVLAVRSGNVELAALLLRHGADARCSDLTGSPAVVLAADLMYTKMLTLLLDHGADVDAYTVKGCSLLADVIGASKRDMANLLLERGANGDISDVYGQPIVVRIVRDEKMAVEEKEDLLQRLMKNGATGDVTDFAWALPVLRYALESDTITTRIIELLLQHDAKPDDVTMADGATALLYAIDKGKRDVARLLVRHGADVNAADEKGRRPLMQAVIRGDVDMVNVLRAAGAKVKDEGMGDVAAVARALGKPEMMKALGL